MTDSYKNEVKDDLLSDFISLFSKDCLCKGINLNKNNCCILPSIGYSDYCLLMADNNWMNAINIIENLHTIKSSNGTPVLSTDYLMPAYHKELKKHIFDNVNLSVRVNLMPGFSARMLANSVPKTIRVYRTSGGTDCLLCADTSKDANELFSFILNNHLSDTNVIIDMSSTLKLRIMPDTELSEYNKISNDSEKLPEDSHLTEALSEFEEAIKEYNATLSNNKKHTRQANSLLELSAIIRNICSQAHTYNLREIIISFIIDFTYCLNRSKDLQDSDIELLIGMLIDRMKSFLADLSRTDCFFMERDRYNHSSVGSSTSLLLAYNKWLNSFTKCVQKATMPDNNSSYSFLVTSGGCDQTQTFNAFYLLDPEIIENQLYEQVPLLIQMSEMSLFDFSGTIIRAVHECMHYCGNRLREERVHDMVDFIVCFFADFLSRMLFGDAYIEYAHAVLDQQINFSEVHDVKQRISVAYDKWRGQFAAEIKEKLLSYFNNEDNENWQQTRYLVRYVKDWISDTLLSAFSGHVFSHESGKPVLLKQNIFATFLYLKQQHILKQFFNECDSICNEYDITIMNFAFGSEKIDVYSHIEKKMNSNELDSVLYKNIQIILSRLLMTEKPLSDSYKYELDQKEIAQKRFPYIDAIENNVKLVADSLADIFSESFADVAACCILNADFEDYILMRVYENWNLDDALGKTFNNSIRIPAVIMVCFFNELNEDGLLTTEATRKIEMAISVLESHGMPKSRLDASEICDKIDKLLESWSVNKTFGESLVQYLAKCKKLYEEKSVKDMLSEYSRAYQKLRLHVIDPKGSDTSQKILEMVYTLIGKKIGVYGCSDKM